MRWKVAVVASSLALATLGGVAFLPGATEWSADAHGSAATISPEEASLAAETQRLSRPEPPKPPPPPPPPPPPTPAEALADGTLIVVSIPSQQAFVFRKGEFWNSTPVSTGKKGKETPTGVYPILQKKKKHRSTLYDDAPMPFMQRITWDGVALHAGRVPGYPASHGCIRLPASFAEKLYGITNYTSTIVLVTDEPVGSAKEARLLT